MTLLDDDHPFTTVNASRARFWNVVEASAALSARARELGDEIVHALADQLAKAAGLAPDDRAQLFAAAIFATWRTAYTGSLGAQRRKESRANVRAAFTSLVTRGFDMVEHAARGTPYGT